jgi:hypothetical protein
MAHSDAASELSRAASEPSLSTFARLHPLLRKDFSEWPGCSLKIISATKFTAYHHKWRQLFTISVGSSIGSNGRRFEHLVVEF